MQDLKEEGFHLGEESISRLGGRGIHEGSRRVRAFDENNACPGQSISPARTLVHDLGGESGAFGQRDVAASAEEAEPVREDA